MEQPEFVEHTLKASDPKLRQILTEHGDLVGIMELHRCLFKSIEHLGPDPAAFQDFIRETVGGHYATHKFRPSGIALYYNNDLQHEEDRSQFNTAATMLLASFASLPLQHVTPVFGTVLLTGFDHDSWQPRPLPHPQLMEAFDQLVANEQAMEVARGLLPEPGSV